MNNKLLSAAAATCESDLELVTWERFDLVRIFVHETSVAVNGRLELICEWQAAKILVAIPTQENPFTPPSHYPKHKCYHRIMVFTVKVYAKVAQVAKVQSGKVFA